MPPRKDLMRVIRSDQSFSATLGFGRTEQVYPENERPSEAGNIPKSNPEPVLPSASDATPDLDATGEDFVAPELPSPTGRGVVIYVAVSLTAAQAIRAERWAAAASCAVPLLMRRTAQAMRKGLFDAWAAKGVDRIDEQRGSRGYHPTSITLTLPPDLAAAFSAQLDPMAVIGLGRAIGPAFRLHFDAAFDAAADKAGF